MWVKDTCTHVCHVTWTNSPILTTTRTCTHKSTRDVVLSRFCHGCCDVGLDFAKSRLARWASSQFKITAMIMTDNFLQALLPSPWWETTLRTKSETHQKALPKLWPSHMADIAVHWTFEGRHECVFPLDKNVLRLCFSKCYYFAHLFLHVAQNGGEYGSPHILMLFHGSLFMSTPRKTSASMYWIHIILPVAELHRDKNLFKGYGWRTVQSWLIVLLSVPFDVLSQKLNLTTRLL